MTKPPSLTERLRRLATETVARATTIVLERATSLIGTKDNRRLPSPPPPPVPPTTAAASAPAASSTLSSPTAPPPEPAKPSRPPEPFAMLDLAEPPHTYGTDEVHVIPQDPGFLFFYWEVTPGGWDRAKAHLRGDGALTLRLWSTTDDGRTDEIDVALDWDHGRRYLAAPRPGAHVSAAVGVRTPDGRFAAIAHAPRTRVPWAEPGPDAPIEWMIVEPDATRGAERRRPPILKVGRQGDIAGAPPPGTRIHRWRQGMWENVGSSRAASGAIDAELEERPSSPWRWPRSEAP